MQIFLLYLYFRSFLRQLEVRAVFLILNGKSFSLFIVLHCLTVCQFVTFSWQVEYIKGSREYSQ